jgi:predicted ABC-type transport system involved in lysophospholipase L1 biosynthesis ATPase subunit
MRSFNLKTTAIALAILIAVFFVFGLRVQHPRAGLGNAVGSAQSSLVIVKKVDEVKPGDKIVAGAQVGKSPVLGIVATIEKGSIELQIGSGIARSTQDRVAGKLLVVIPFVGLIFNAVGL